MYRQIIDMILNVSQQKRKRKICRILSKKSGKALSISIDPQTRGVVILKQSSLYPQSLFHLQRHQSKFVIRSELTDQCLSIYGASTQVGAMAITLPEFNHECQKFELTKLTRQNQYALITFCGMALDCCEQGTQEGTRIIQWPFQNKDHQIWTIELL